MKQSREPLARDASTEAAGDIWASRARPLRECGEIAATRLAVAFSDAVKRAADQLFAKGAQGPASHEQRMWLDAADFARSRRQDMVDAFRKHFQHRYTLACRPKSALASSHTLDFDINQLKVVDHDVLDNTLDPADLIDALRNGTWTSLHDLTKWFREMRGEPELLPVDMPLGPKLVGGAVANAINDQFWGHEAKLRLIRALDRTFPELVNRIYGDLNAHLTRMEEAAPTSEEIESRITPQPRIPDTAPGKGGVEPDVPSTEPAFALQNGDAPSPDALVDTTTPMAALADVDAAIAKRLEARRLPGFIHEFLAGPWHSLLIHIHRESGSSGPEWEAALTTMDDLARSLRPPANAGERARRMRELPELVRRLGMGLETLNPAPAAHEAFFARLADRHIKLLSPPRPAPDMPSVYVPTEIPLEALQVGIWLEMSETGAPAKALKLAWISPHRKLFVLTNQQGQRALSLNAKDLAARLRDGKARILHTPDDARAENGLPQSPDDKKSA